MLFKVYILRLHTLRCSGGIDIAAMKEDMGFQDKMDKLDEKQKRQQAKRVSFSLFS